VAAGQVDREARAVLFNCATGLKYPLPAAGIPLARGTEPDWASLA
jgi:threonine synthase